MVAQSLQPTHFFRKYTGYRLIVFWIPSTQGEASLLPLFYQNITKSHFGCMQSATPSRRTKDILTASSIHSRSILRTKRQFPTFSKTSILGSMHETLPSARDQAIIG